MLSCLGSKYVEYFKVRVVGNRILQPKIYKLELSVSPMPKSHYVLVFTDTLRLTFV